jgi:hypothetical protein
MRLSQIGQLITSFEQDGFNNNELMEGVKMWLSSITTDFFDKGIKYLFPDTTSASIQAATMLRSSISMYLSFHIIKFRFLIACFLTPHWRILSE